MTSPFATAPAMKTIGVLGVIGPTRMAYDRVVPVVDVTAKLLESVLSHGPGDPPKKSTD